MIENGNKEVEFDDDIFDSMINGSFVEEDSSDAVGGDGAEEPMEDPDESEHQEDTEVDDEYEEDDTDEAGDGELDEEEIDEDVEDGEDSLVGDDSLDEEDDDAEDEVDNSDEENEAEAEDIDDESEDDTDTEEPSDGEAPATDAIDYKSFYESVVNTEFTVNGRKTKGFSDPKKIIQSMQMAGGFSDKMAAFKQYRPFMGPLKDRGMLEDQTKFDLAMNIMDGDKEAMKKHMASLSIDPLDFDMDDIAYEAKSTTATNESLVVQDALDRARNSGVEERLRDVVGNQWDEKSFSEFVSNPSVREDLINHLETGVYDKVQDKINQMKMSDYNGSFNDMNAICKYRAAVVELQIEAAVVRAPVTPTPQPAVAKPVKQAASASVKQEKANIAAARKEAEYKKQVSARNAKTADDRRKATSLSKRKAPAKAKAKFDPMALEGEEFDAHMELLMSGGR
jgi:hypothetical protein